MTEYKYKDEHKKLYEKAASAVDHEKLAEKKIKTWCCMDSCS